MAPPEETPEFDNPSDARRTEILTDYTRVAVVGLTPDPEAAAHKVAHFLNRHGFRIFPVNPRYPSVLGEICYPFLRNIGQPIDVVVVFRRPEHLGGLIEDAVKAGAKVIWLQKDIVNVDFARQAQEAGLEVVMDRCMKKEYERLILKSQRGRNHGRR